MRIVRPTVVVYALTLLAGLTCVGLAGTAQEPSSDASNAGQQSPLAIFRADANFVEVHAVVTDGNGVFMPGLTQEDFEIYEEGEAQTPSVFALVNLPVEPRFTPANATEPVESDVRGTTGSVGGRIFLFVLDDLHTMFTRTQSVREAASRFVERNMGVNDLAAVVHTSGYTNSAQELTSSRRLLLEAIYKFQGRKLRSAGAEKLAAHLYQMAQPGDDFYSPQVSGVDTRNPNALSGARMIRDSLDHERGTNARRTLRMIRDAAKEVEDIRGRRKALLLFSEGLDYDIYEPFNRTWASAMRTFASDAVAAAQRANVTVYGIDPRGLNTAGGTFTVDVQSVSLYPQLQYGSVLGFAKELRLAQESLISLADETGGIAVINTNDIGGALERISGDSTRYYLLGYHSDPENWSAGDFRKIEVRMKRPGLRVRARRGFVVPSPEEEIPEDEQDEELGASPTLRVALNTLVPVGDLPIRVFAASFRGERKDASVLVVVEMDGRAFKFEEREGRFYENIELSIAAVDHRANILGGENQTLNLNFSPETHQVVSRTGIRLLSRLEIPDGRYQLRVGVHETVGGTSGTVPYDLEVPDHSKATFTLSGLVLTSSYAASYATNAPDPELQDVLPGPPTANRRFTPEETLTSFMEVYDRSSERAHAIDYDATVWRGSDGRVVFNSRDRQAVRAGRRKEVHTHGFRTDVPLRDFRPGMYVLRVKAATSTGDHSALREVPFEVSSGLTARGTER